MGILANVPLSDPRSARLWGEFVHGLRDLGYVDGRNVMLDTLSSDGKYERLPALAAELVRHKVDVIVAPAAQNVVAAKQASQTIPIVMVSVGDPVGNGLVASLARPGGSVTGGVHRGPDKFPRRNAIRAVFLHAMAQDQEREHLDPSTGEVERGADGKPVKRKIKFAMVQDIVMAYQLIARNAASGKDLDQFLRMMNDAHGMLQPEKDEAGEGRAPIPARFVYAPDAPEPAGGAPAPPVAAPAKAASSSGGAIVTADGKVYE